MGLERECIVYAECIEIVGDNLVLDAATGHPGVEIELAVMEMRLKVGGIAVHNHEIAVLSN